MLAGGASRTFTWTLTGSAPGSLVVTTTVTGTDVNSGAALATGPRSAAVAIADAGTLAGAGSIPVTVSAGQWFQVALTVTNTGGLSVDSITATVYAGPGGALVSRPLGPSPAGVASIAPGASQTFLFSCTATGAGPVAFTVTAAGTTLCGGFPVPVTVAATVTTTVQVPATLVAGLTAFPNPRNIGQGFLVTLTVTNTGQAAAMGLNAAGFLTSGVGVTYGAGPLPALPVTLAGGASLTFSWTDANAGWALGKVAGSNAVVIQAPAALAASAAAFPSPVLSGSGFLVTVTVTNTGNAAATGITPAAFLLSGTGGAVLSAGPIPAAGLSLAGGASVTFTWTYTAGATGTVVLTTTVTATDANTGAALAAGPVVAGPVTVQTPAVLAAMVAAYPTPRDVGQGFLVTLPVRRSGRAPATRRSPPRPRACPSPRSGSGPARPSLGRSRDRPPGVSGSR
jgi:hypothetical protein